MVGFTTSALHQQGSASMSPISWSSHKVKRSVSASLAGEVFMMSEGFAEANGSVVCWNRRSIKTTNTHYIDGNRNRDP